MLRIDIDSSSAIASAGFEVGFNIENAPDPSEWIGLPGELEIQFTDGTVYTYENVPYDVFQELTEAPSAGAYFNSDIRNAYSYRRS